MQEQSIPDTVVAYMASAVECEGCISIVETKSESGRPVISMRVQVYNGKVQRTAYWGGLKAQELLKLLFPYLVSKKDQAELAIKFQDLVNAKDIKKRPLTTEEIESRRVFVNLVKLTR